VEGQNLGTNRACVRCQTVPVYADIEKTCEVVFKDQPNNVKALFTNVCKALWKGPVSELNVVESKAKSGDVCHLLVFS